MKTKPTQRRSHSISSQSSWEIHMYSIMRKCKSFLSGWIVSRHSTMHSILVNEHQFSLEDILVSIILLGYQFQLRPIVYRSFLSLLTKRIAIFGRYYWVAVNKSSRNDCMTQSSCVLLSPAIARWNCFHPVCLFVCVCVSMCHDVCPDDLTMKDWCHTNNILQVHCWGCLVVQVMFHALMTSSMTSPGHKVSQILKLIYLRQYFSWSVDQKLKMSDMLMAIFLLYSTSGITSGKKVCREL